MKQIRTNALLTLSAMVIDAISEGWMNPDLLKKVARIRAYCKRRGVSSTYEFLF